MTTPLRFLPYGRQVILEEDIEAVVGILKSDFLTQGPAVGRFEQALANFIGCKHVVVVNSATAALHLAYRAIGVQAGDAVIVPAITFAATANAAVYCGATPVFADVDPVSGNVTAQTVEAAIAVAKTRGLAPKLVVPVHYGGMPVEMAAIIKVAEFHGAKVFEDACHALGGQYRSEGGSWQKAGNWQDGSCGASFSFHPVKHVATGEGGALATNDDAIAEKARLWRTHGITKDAAKFRLKDQAYDSQSDEAFPWYYEMQDLGWNYRLSDICAALGESQIKRLPQSVAKRIEIAGWYDEILKDFPIMRPSSGNDVAKHAWHLYPVQIDFAALKISRRDVMMKLRQDGIGPQVHYIPVPSLPYYKARGEKAPPGAELFYKRELSLPMYTDLNRDDIKRVCASLQNALQNR